MSQSKIFPVYWKEYSVNTENLTFRMLGDMRDKGYYPENEPEHIILSLNQLHTHTYAEMFVCMSGTISIKTAQNQIDMAAGDLVIIPVEIEHVKCSDLQEGEWFSISFTCVRRHARGCQNLFSIYNRICTNDGPIIIRNQPEFCSTALRISEGSSGKMPAMIALDLMHLLTDITDLYFSSSPQPRHYSSSEETDINRAAHLQHIITTQFMNNITPQSVADQLFVSTRQLERIMKKRYGKSLRQTIIELRLKAAAEMLLLPERSAEEIGRTVGFTSKATFYREFSKKFGIPPMQYRKQNKTVPL